MGIESIGPDHEIRAFALDGVRIEQRADEGSERLRLSGYAAVFNRTADIGGRFDEVIRPGAFSRAIEERQDVVLLFNHEPSTVMARTSNGTLRLREDEIGLWFEADLDPHDSDAQRVIAKVRSGNVSQGSFSFTVRSETWHQDRPKPLRELLDLDLYDVSPVTWPAYAETAVHARGRVVAPPPPPAPDGEAGASRQQVRHRQRQIEMHRAYLALMEVSHG